MYSVSSIFFVVFLCLYSEVVNCQECPALSKCQEIRKVAIQYRCESDRNCVSGLKCCTHGCYYHKVCLPPKTINTESPSTTRIIKEDNILLKSFDKQCPYYSCVHKTKEHNDNYRCESDMMCQTNYQCCEHSCYSHKVCVPIGELLEEYTRPTSTTIEPILKPIPIQKCPAVEVQCNESLLSYVETLRCYSDWNCADGHFCCEHSCYKHKVCRRGISERNEKEEAGDSSEEVELEDNYTCPETKCSTYSKVSDSGNICSTDRNCGGIYRCCSHDCYIHKICVDPRLFRATTEAVTKEAGITTDEVESTELENVTTTESITSSEPIESGDDEVAEESSDIESSGDNISLDHDLDDVKTTELYEETAGISTKSSTGKESTESNTNVDIEDEYIPSGDGETHAEEEKILTTESKKGDESDENDDLYSGSGMESSDNTGTHVDEEVSVTKNNNNKDGESDDDENDGSGINIENDYLITEGFTRTPTEKHKESTTLPTFIGDERDDSDNFNNNPLDVDDDNIITEGITTTEKHKKSTTVPTFSGTGSDDSDNFNDSGSGEDEGDGGIGDINSTTEYEMEFSTTKSDKQDTNYSVNKEDDDFSFEPELNVNITHEEGSGSGHEVPISPILDNEVYSDKDINSMNSLNFNETHTKEYSKEKVDLIDEDSSSSNVLPISQKVDNTDSINDIYSYSDDSDSFNGSGSGEEEESFGDDIDDINTDITHEKEYSNNGNSKRSIGLRMNRQTNSNIEMESGNLDNLVDDKIVKRLNSESITNFNDDSVIEDNISKESKASLEILLLNITTAEEVTITESPSYIQTRPTPNISKYLQMSWFQIDFANDTNTSNSTIDNIPLETSHNQASIPNILPDIDIKNGSNRNISDNTISPISSGSSSSTPVKIPHDFDFDFDVDSNSNKTVEKNRVPIISSKSGSSAQNMGSSPIKIDGANTTDNNNEANSKENETKLAEDLYKKDNAGKKDNSNIVHNNIILASPKINHNDHHVIIGNVHQKGNPKADDKNIKDSDSDSPRNSEDSKKYDVHNHYHDSGWKWNWSWS